MKKFLAMLLGAALSLSIGVTAFAETAAIEAGSETELIDAIENANDGDIIKLTGDIEVTNASGAVNNGGAFTVEKNITIDGAGHTVKAVGDGWAGEGSAAASMFNIQNDAKVIFRNLTIDNAGLGKHGINMFGASVEVEGVKINDGKGYAIVCNSGELKVTSLETSGNAWGGINGDAKVDGKEYSIEIVSANVKEENSVCLENAGSVENNKLSISGGSFVNVGKHPTDYPEGAPETAVSISGGSYKNDVSAYTAENAVVVSTGEKYSVGDDAVSVIKAAKSGDTVTVVKAPKDAEFKDISAGVTVKNDSGNNIFVNGKTVTDKGSIKLPESSTSRPPVGSGNTETIVVGGGSGNKNEGEKNPGTGAPSFIGAAALLAAVSVFGIVVSKKK